MLTVSGYCAMATLRFALLASCLLLSMMLCAPASSSMDAHEDVVGTALPAQVPQCTLLQLLVPIPSAPSFDPWNFTQANCGAVFTFNGTSYKRDAFVFQNYSRVTAGQWDNLQAVGDPSFLVRFAPVAAGQWQYTFGCMNGSVTANGSFAVVEADGRNSCAGFLRRARYDLYSFAFSENNERWYGLGENNCWGNEQSYDSWWQQLAPHHANYSRIWVSYNSPFVLQSMQVSLGTYDLQAAWRLDVLLEKAVRYNMRLMLSLYSYNWLQYNGEYNGCWSNCNPYVAPLDLQSPIEFFTDGAARLYQAQYHRYMVARYAWSPYVLAWEWWNEVDGMADYNASVVCEWHQWASNVTLRPFDTYAQHPITTSFAQHRGYPPLDGSSALDFTQTHAYEENDYFLALWKYVEPKATAYAKPSWIGEMGMSDPSITEYDDPTGVMIFNAQMGAPFALGAVGGAVWWWDSWVDPYNLYWRWETPNILQSAMHVLMDDKTQWNITQTASANVTNSNLSIYALSNPSPSAGFAVLARNNAVNWKSQLNNNENTPPPLPAFECTVTELQPLRVYHYVTVPLNATLDSAAAGRGKAMADTKGRVAVAVPSNHWGLALLATIDPERLSLP